MTHPAPVVDGLTWRPLTSGDLDAWWALVDRVQEADRPRHLTTRVGLGRTAARPETRLDANSLGVDSANPSGAGGIYTAHGYERAGGSTYWSTPL